MGMWVGRGRKARAAYGFDDIALVPGSLTVNPNEVDISWELCGHRYALPIIAAAMDGVVGPKLATEMGRHGGLAVLNLEGIFSRYANPDDVLDRIVSASQEEATKIIQSIYSEPIKEELIHQRIRAIKKGGGPAVVSSIPQRAERFGQIAQEAGADIFVVQSTVTTARHIATEYTPVDLRKLKKHLAIPLVIGNVATYEACLGLMRSEEHTSELQSHSELVCRPLLEKKKSSARSARARSCGLAKTTGRWTWRPSPPARSASTSRWVSAACRVAGWAQLKVRNPPARQL